MDTKRCPRCRREKEIAAFSQDRSRRDGRRSWCKECYREYANSPRGKEARYHANRRYYETEKGREARGRGIRAYWRRYPLRKRAVSLIGKAVFRGKLSSASTCICMNCGNTAQEYHHPDYSRPLVVEPLCRKCHTVRHTTS